MARQANSQLAEPRHHYIGLDDTVSQGLIGAPSSDEHNTQIISIGNPPASKPRIEVAVAQIVTNRLHIVKGLPIPYVPRSALLTTMRLGLQGET